MSKSPITITATTLGRAQHIPGYHQREYMDEGDIPNHIAATLAFIRKDLKPGEKIIVQDRKLYIVEKTAFDRFKDWVAGRKLEKSARASANLVLHPEG
ncbi:hypothetical protein ANRL1_03696 [Anaerolineae bacterium]|nr:hypothetical protein ANRL1_03696 [Anaerolineae bacterium]